MPRHKWTPQLPSNPLPASLMPPTEIHHGIKFTTLAGTVQQAFRTLGESMPNDLLIGPAPRGYSNDHVIMVKGMSNELDPIGRPYKYGQEGSEKYDQEFHRALLLMQRLSIRRSLYKKATGKSPGSYEPLWASLFNPLVLSLTISAGSLQRHGKKNLDIYAPDCNYKDPIWKSPDELAVVYQTMGMHNMDSMVKSRVNVTVDLAHQIPESLKMSLEGRPLRQVVEFKPCGIAEVDEAVNQLRIRYLDENEGRIQLSIEPARLMYDPRTPNPNILREWTEHLDRHPVIA